MSVQNDKNKKKINKHRSSRCRKRKKQIKQTTLPHTLRASCASPYLNRLTWNHNTNSIRTYIAEALYRPVHEKKYTFTRKGQRFCFVNLKSWLLQIQFYIWCKETIRVYPRVYFHRKMKLFQIVQTSAGKKWIGCRALSPIITIQPMKMYATRRLDDA